MSVEERMGIVAAALRICDPVLPADRGTGDGCCALHCPGYSGVVNFSRALRSAVTGPTFRWTSAPSGTARHPVSITTASVSLEQQHRVRVRKYVIVSSLRILAFVLSAVVYSLSGNPWVAVAIIGASLPLPWIVALIVDDLPPWEKDESHGSG